MKSNTPHRDHPPRAELRDFPASVRGWLVQRVGGETRIWFDKRQRFTRPPQAPDVVISRELTDEHIDILRLAAADGLTLSPATADAALADPDRRAGLLQFYRDHARSVYLTFDAEGREATRTPWHEAVG